MGQNLETIQNEHKNLLEDIRAKESSLRLQLESMLQMEKEKAVKDFALKDALQDDLRTVHAEKIELSKVIEVLRKNEAMEKGKILALQGDLKTLIAEKKDLSKIIEQLRKSEAMEKEKTVEFQNNLKALQAERKDLSKEIETLRKDEALEKEKIVKRLEMENCLQNDLNKNLSDVNKRLAEKTSELKEKNEQYECAQREIKELKTKRSEARKDLQAKECLLQSNTLDLEMLRTENNNFSVAIESLKENEKKKSGGIRVHKQATSMRSKSIICMSERARKCKPITFICK